MEVFAVSLRSPALKNTALQALMNLERFLVGKRRNSNPQGIYLYKTDAPSPKGPRAPNIKKISAQFRKASRMQQPSNHRPRESGDTGLGLSRVPHEQEAT